MQNQASNPGLPLGLGKADVPVYTVTQLNRQVRGLLESAFDTVWLEGEVSNFTHHRSGHMYFTLKDEGAQVDAAMFRTANQRLTFSLESGMRVLALVQVTVYEPRGRYQVVVQAIKPAGVGKLQRAFEQLKAKLQAEGLFNDERKRPLPHYPTRIGIVTASGAAALRDICTVLVRRYPLVEVLLFHAQVQGEGAGQQVAEAIERANRYSEPPDVLIVGRGGGSLEDLWAFNEEVVARAIAASNVPVVSAVGHEVDVTIADYVADVRAPTPSAAAELVVPDRVEILQTLRAQTQRIIRLSVARWREAGSRLAWIKRSHGLRRPLQRLRDMAQRLDQAQAALGRGLLKTLTPLQQRRALLQARLEQANPAALLQRGYALAQDPSGQTVRRVEQVRVGDRLTVKLSDGRIVTRVEEVKRD